MIPHQDLDEYSRLRDTAKIELSHWADAVREITDATHGIGDLIANWAVTLGCSPGHIRKQLGRWRSGTADFDAGDWRILVNKARAGVAWWGGQADPLPEAFLDHVAGFHGQNQRGKFRTQYRALIRQWDRWRQGDPTAKLPGYPECPAPDPAGRHPVGWSYRNLLRLTKARPHHRAELAIHTLGTAAALKLLPGVPGTREGVRPLEYVFFDDVYLDRKVIVSGWREPCRLLQLGCLDYCSGMYLKFGQQPELPTEDGARERLKERYMTWLVAALLEEYGWPAEYPMHLILERGTATLRRAEAQSLYDLTGGQVRCCYTTMEGELALLWEERSTGNSRGKAALESWHNLFHNECATLPGQIGKDRDHCPAEIAGRTKEAVALATATALLPPEQSARLKLPFSDKDKAFLETLDIVNRVNRRVMHDLEGFEWVPLWRVRGVPMNWQPEAALASAPQALDHLDLLEWDRRRERPIERFHRLTQGLTFHKLPPGIIGRFCADAHVLGKITAYEFAFERDGKRYTYIPPTAADALPEGNEYLGYFNPFQPDLIHLATKDGAYVTTWPRETKVRRGDQAALADALKRKRSFLNANLATVRRQRAEEITAADQAARDNLRVLTENGLIPERADPPAHHQGHVQEVCPPNAQAMQTAVIAIAALKKDQAAEAQTLAGRATEEDLDAFSPIGPISPVNPIDDFNEL